MENRVCDSKEEILEAVHRLRPCAVRWSLNGHDADDLLQSTAERALLTTAQYRPGTNATAWVRAIMYHLAVDSARRRRRERALHAAYGHEGPDRQPAIEDDLLALPDGRPRPSMADVRHAATRLREPVRTTFLLWALERLSYKEISRRLNVPINTVATRLLRARRDLRLLVADLGRSGPEDRSPAEPEALAVAA